jgi:curved DNA-binding protein CbpA
MTGVMNLPADAREEDGGGADAFRVLGLGYSPDLDDEDVRRACLRRLRAVHPDNSGDARAAAAVTAAYEALRSGVRRGELLTAAMVDRGDPAPPRGARRPAVRAAQQRRRACRMRRGARSCARRSQRRGRRRDCRRSSLMRPP